MITPEKKKQAKISLLKEAIIHLREDFERVQTDHGKTSILSDIEGYEKELDAVTNDGISYDELKEIEKKVESGWYSEDEVFQLIAEIRRLRSKEV